MIIVDLSQVMLSNIMMSIKNNNDIHEDVIRHMILNSIRSYNVKFAKEYGDMVLACDAHNLWRKDVFPYYKANRKKSRDASTLDWKKLFEIIDKVRDEIKDNFPYRVIRIDKAEADDVIASLVVANSLEDINNNNKILIVSGDRDFVQLQRFPNVKQYDPVQKKMVVTSNPRNQLIEKIVRGDVGDGVPNILSADNSLVMGIRQKPVMSSKVNEWLKMKPEEFCLNGDMLRNYKRNELLIDLALVPKDIMDQVLTEYESQSGKRKDKLVNYFMKNKLVQLFDFIQDF